MIHFHNNNLTRGSFSIEYFVNNQMIFYMLLKVIKNN